MAICSRGSEKRLKDSFSAEHQVSMKPVSEKRKGPPASTRHLTPRGHLRRVTCGTLATGLGSGSLGGLLLVPPKATSVQAQGHSHCHTS